MIRFGRDQNWHKSQSVTPRMEILQVKRVVHHLIDGARVVVLGPHLEFNDEDDALMNHNDIDTLAHAWDGELKRNPPGADWSKLLL